MGITPQQAQKINEITELLDPHMDIPEINADAPPNGKFLTFQERDKLLREGIPPQSLLDAGIAEQREAPFSPLTGYFILSEPLRQLISQARDGGPELG